MKFFLDGHEVEAIVVSDEVDCKAKVTEASRTTNSVQVCFGGHGEVEVDDYVHSLDVNTTCQEV